MLQKTKGSILAYSLLILAMMFAIIGSMSSIATLQKKSAGSSQASSQAFQITDNAVQIAVKKINAGIATSSTIAQSFSEYACADNSNGATVKGNIESDSQKPFVLSFTDTDNKPITTCATAVRNISNIKSVGSFQNTTRAVSVKVGSDDPCAGLTAPIVDSSGNKYGFVVGTDKRCWLDRNLGAASYPTVITGPTDPNGYGWYFQWGRSVDGHQISTSAVTLGPVASSNPGSNFIKTVSGTENWYNGPSPDSLWSGTTNEYGVNNNPCPTGWHIPTGGQDGELDKYFKSTGLGNPNCSSDCINKLFNVKNYFNTGPGLQLTAAGFRRYSDGVNSIAGTLGLYWTSNFTQGTTNAGMINFTSTYINPPIVSPKGTGASVRCIRNQ